MMSLDSHSFGYPTGSHSYTDDGNGSLYTDPTKAATPMIITYNLLNLPKTITGGRTITYTYDASGEKLRRVSSATGNTDYVGGIQYDGTSTSSISFIQTDEGRALPDGAIHYNYEYSLNDHSGNSRISFDTKSGITNPVQTDDYLPFGFHIANTTASPTNNYLYNRKELQSELAQYNYGARFYDPLIARWGSIDALAERYHAYPPYSYTANNPIALLDPDGRDVIQNPDGSITFNNDNGTDDAVQAMRLTQRKSKNMYLDIERRAATRT